MIETSIYENYKIEFNDKYQTDDDAYYFIFNEKRELYLDENKNLPLQKPDFEINFSLYIGKFLNYDCFVANTNQAGNFYDLREIYEIRRDLYLIASRAVLINDWFISHQYCGHCGTKTVVDDKDMMMRCPQCQQVHYPRIAPAIIVAIRKDNELLMAKHSYHNSDRYALIAGFVEPGETIEEAVTREIAEEVGLKVKNINYLKSQSWPFPNSLMLAFEAEYESGEITVDDDEIVDAKWFKVSDIKNYPTDISISSWLIENVINNNK